MVEHQGDGGETVEFFFIYFPLENKSNHCHQKTVYIYSIRSKATASLTITSNRKYIQNIQLPMNGHNCSQLQHFITTYLHYGATYLWKINQIMAIRNRRTYTASAQARKRVILHSI